MSVSGIGAVGGGGYMPVQSMPATQAPVPGSAAGAPAAAAGASSQSISSVLSNSISSSVQSFIGTYGPAMSNDELLGALLLMLTLEYLKGGQSDDEKQNLLGLILALAQQKMNTEGAGSGTFAFTSSSMSIEGTQMQSISMTSAAGAYQSAQVNPQVAPGVDAGSAGLDVTI